MVIVLVLAGPFSSAGAAGETHPTPARWRTARPRPGPGPEELA